MKFEFTGRKIKFDYWDIAFVVLLLVTLGMQYDYLSKFKQLPSPAYGGDFYNGLGSVLHIMYGGDPLASAQMIGEHPWVPWLYHVAVAAFAIITGMNGMHGLLYFSLVLQFLGGIVFYKLLSFDGKCKPAALAGILLFAAAFPILKYSNTATILTLPLFALSLLYLFDKQTIKRALLAGIALGICGLSNTQAFFVSNILFVVAFGLHAYLSGYAKKEFWKDENVKQFIKIAAIVFFVGFLLSLLFWYKPLFVYKGSTPNDIQNITTPDLTIPNVLGDSIKNLIMELLFPYGFSIPYILLSAFSVCGLIASIKNYKEDLVSRIAIAAVLTQFICIIHPWITLPLLNMHFVNFMMTEKIALLTTVLLMRNGFGFLAQKLSSVSNLLFFVLAIVIILPSGVVFMDYQTSHEKDEWTKTGREALPPAYAELTDWINKNSGVNDVFLSDNEDSFMINSLTGRKSVSYRRTHASPYSDMNQKMADQAVMVYGSNDAKRLELLKQYNVKYLVWSSMWLFLEYDFDVENNPNAEGKLIGIDDALAIPNNAANTEYWTKNGVRFSQFLIPLDPAPRPNAPVYDVIVAFPPDIVVENPYDPGLLNHFKLVKTIKYNGNDYFKIYKIDIN